MYISFNWISDYVDTSGIDVKELANRLTMATAEVEGVIEHGKDIKNVVVGKIVEVKPNPSSDKLTIVKVDVGDEIVQSLCGAPNVEEGILVPFAKVGGSIKKVDQVKSMQVEGVESNGIVCSAAELGISDDHTGILVLDTECELGTDIKEIIDIDDAIIEIDNKSLTHRPDLWGHYGIAREVAALYERKLKELEIEEINNSLPQIDIDIQDKEKCYRYSCVSIDNINKKVSPLNMQSRLYYCGVRPISLLVDLTNYLMLELGQPMHAFDKKYIQEITVKSTEQTTKFTTLDGEEREIPEDVLMICNQDGPVALAGIMGGENSEISENTNSIVLESANFEGSSTRTNATKIGLRTEASARFEKMLDPELTVLAIKRFAKLLKDIDNGVHVSSALSDSYARKYNPITITIDKAYVDKYIGKDIGLEKMIQILKSLDFSVKADGENFEIKVPSFRATKDVTIKADIVEEIARIYGYDNIEPETTEVVLEPLQYNEQRIMDHKVKEILAEQYGLSEVHSYIWYDNKANTELGIGLRDGLKVINSSAEGMDTLRDSITPSMLNFTQQNVKNYEKFGMFEIGSVFSIQNKSELCEEHKNLCILIASKDEKEDSLFYEAKGILNSIFKVLKSVEPDYKKGDKILEYPWVHPVKSAQVVYKNNDLGYISVVHPKIKENVDKKLNMVAIEVNMFKVNDIKETIVSYKEPSKYQEVTLDLSILVDTEIPYEKVNNDIDEFKNNLLLDYKFTDIYTGKGIPQDKKSMTFNFRISSSDHTLSSEEIEDFRQNLIKHVENKGYSLR